MSRTDQMAAEYLVRQVRAEKLESPQPRRDHSRTSPLEAVAGFAAVGLVFVLIFWGIA